MFLVIKSRFRTTLTRSAAGRTARAPLTPWASPRASRHARLNLEALDERLLLTGGPVTMPVPQLGSDYFLIKGAPSQVTAGTSFPVTVTEYSSSNGTVVTSASGLTASLNISVGGIATSVGSVPEGGSGKASVTLTKSEQVDALIATSGSLSNLKSYVSGATGIIQVNPAAASQFAVNSQATVTAGSGFTVQVTAEDRYDNPITYNGTVVFKSSDGQAVSGTGAS